MKLVQIISLQNNYYKAVTKVSQSVDEKGNKTVISRSVEQIGPTRLLVFILARPR
jgi:hypothetical protein